ncbi:hypothetical protein KKD80_03360 [Patescibacteria group bacterium]|nr:hypothetical protein [Patescibacteria group bacterium]
MDNNFFLNRSDQRLKRDAFQILAIATIPMENWFAVFFDKKDRAMMNRPGLRRKTFYIWFPTMIDFLKDKSEKRIKDLYDEIHKRKIKISKIEKYTFDLIDFFKKILSLYSEQEQLFLYDRRLQNVHGFLDIYFDGWNLRWFDIKHNKIDSKFFKPNDYKKIIVPLYKDMQNKSERLLERFVKSAEGEGLKKFYENKLKSPKLRKLIKFYKIKGVHIAEKGEK